MGEGPGRRIPRNQLSHPVERDPGVLVLGEEPAEELGELGDEAQVVYEERKVTERKPRGLDWRGGQEKDSPRSQADRTGAYRVQDLRQEAVSQHRLPAL